MGCPPLLAKAKEGGHPISYEGRDTHQLWPSQPTLWLNRYDLVASIVWWLPQSMDFNYFYSWALATSASLQAKTISCN